MTYTGHSLFTVTLTSQAYQLAKTLRSQYQNEPNRNERKAQQVYLNTLAVYAVATYCECLGIETNLEDSDSLNSVMQPLMNIADLEIERIGKLECRPVSVNDENCYIPIETWENRIGYIAVEIDDEGKEATLLGFYPPVNPLEMMESIPISEFKPLATFIDHLDRIESGLETVSSFFFRRDNPINLINFEEEESFTHRLTPLLAQLAWNYPINRVQSIQKLLANLISDENLIVDKPETQSKINFRSLKVLSQEPLSNPNELQNIFPIINSSLRSRISSLRSSPQELETLAQELAQQLDQIWRFTPVSISAWIKNIDQTIDNIMASAWQNLESFLESKPQHFSLQFDTVRSHAQPHTAELATTKIKEIQLGNHLLALMLKGEQKSQETVDLQVRLYPSSEAEISLPSGIKLMMSKASEQKEKISGNADNWIQLAFEGHLEEQFTITVQWGEESVTEDFMI